MDKKIIVYICTFNRPDMLRESIQSVLNQTYRNIEVVVLDNASTDNTQEVALSFSDSRVKYIRHETNIGAENWNYVWGHADCEYVNIFHDDDMMLPWMIEEEAKILDEHKNVGFVGCKPLLSSGVTKMPERPLHFTSTFYRKKEFIKELCRAGYNPLIPSCVLFRKNCMIDNGLRFRPFSAGDLYLWIEANLLDAFEICVIDEPLFQYRVHSKSGSAANAVKDGWWEAQSKIVDELLLSTCPELDISGLRQLFAIWSLMPTMKKYCAGNVGRKELLAERERIAAERDWHLPDWRLEDKLAVTYLEDVVLAVKAGERPFGDYLDAVIKANEIGVEVSRKREHIWFGKSFIRT